MDHETKAIRAHDVFSQSLANISSFVAQIEADVPEDFTASSDSYKIKRDEKYKRFVDTLPSLLEQGRLHCATMESEAKKLESIVGPGHNLVQEMKMLKKRGVKALEYAHKLLTLAKGRRVFYPLTLENADFWIFIEKSFATLNVDFLSALEKYTADLSGKMEHLKNYERQFMANVCLTKIYNKSLSWGDSPAEALNLQMKETGRIFLEEFDHGILLSLLHDLAMAQIC